MIFVTNLFNSLIKYNYFEYINIKYHHAQDKEIIKILFIIFYVNKQNINIVLINIIILCLASGAVTNTHLEFKLSTLGETATRKQTFT